MNEGRLLRRIRAFHHRLADARERVREGPSSAERVHGESERDELSGAKMILPQVETTPSQLGEELEEAWSAEPECPDPLPSCSVCGKELASSVFRIDGQLMCAPCLVESRASERMDRSPESGESEEGLRCSRCAEPMDQNRSIPDGDPYCADCKVDRRSQSQPVGAWREELTDGAKRAVLEELEKVYPKALSARELADRLRRLGYGMTEVNKSRVNSLLYADLNDWLVRHPGTPPRWALEKKNAGRLPP